MISKSEHFDAISVEGSLKITKRIAIPPFSSSEVKGVTRICGHTNYVPVIKEPPEVNVLEIVVTMSIYIEIKPGLCRAGFAFCICLPEKSRFQHIL